MSTVVAYPVQVTSYSIFFTEDSAQIQLKGVEKSTKESNDVGEPERNVAFIDFEPQKREENQRVSDFINRGGFLQITRPWYMLPSILVALEQGTALSLDKNGNLSKGAKLATSI